MKTLVIISDLHCGSVYGLLPPKDQQKQSSHHSKIQKEAWIAYTKIIKKWYNPDILLVNGDCIEGRQEKQGGAELFTNDRNVQSEIAVECIKSWKAKQILMSFGTSYHVGSTGEDFEYNIAKKLDAKIEGRLFFNIEGLTFDARHKTSTSCIPHGRGAGILREIMWNLVHEAEEGWPKVDVIVRSHAHYHIWVESHNKIAFITPSLQMSRGRYGSREMSGTTHWGAIRLTINNKQIIRKEVELCRLLANKPSIYRIK